MLSLLSEERPITVDEACALRVLLFGNTARSFGDAWTKQGFKFRCAPVSYGIKQKKAGPCGVLAAVQAHFLFELLFGYNRIVQDSGLLRPEMFEKKEALARALTSILWQAGENKEAILAVQRESVIFNNEITANILSEDGILEYLRLKYFRSKQSLMEYLFNFIAEMMKEKGCVLFLYSLILTHGFERIKEEMDYPDCHLIGDDGYCSQEVINLILIGKAVPNLFNGDLELNSGGEETSILKGIPKQSNIGLLSLYEYHENCPVGSFYKNPVYPIWVLLEESHFTVLFATSRNILNKTEKEDSFELFHCDGLYRRNEEVVLNVKPFANEKPVKDNELNPIVRCILTRWPLADVDFV